MIQAARYGFPPNLFFSRSARKTYKYAAIGSFLFFFAFCGIFVVLSIGVLRPEDSAATKLLRYSMFFGALCIAAMCVSMEYYCFRYDTSSSLARVLWFLLMVAGSPIASLLYFYVVYLPQTRQDQAQALSATNAY